MMYVIYALVVVGCVAMRRIERNTTLMEQHTRELLEKTRKFDALYNKLINAVSV